MILQGVATPGFTRTNRNGSCNITAYPSGGKVTIIMTGQVGAKQHPSHQKMKFYTLKK